MWLSINSDDNYSRSLFFDIRNVTFIYDIHMRIVFNKCNILSRAILYL